MNSTTIIFLDEIMCCKHVRVASVDKYLINYRGQELQMMHAFI